MKKLLKKLLAIFLTVCMCAAMFAGCTKRNEKPITTHPPTDIQKSAPRKKILCLNNNATPVLDPGSHVGYIDSVAYLNLYETLVFPKGDDFEPCLAESWQSNENGDAYTFKLKKGIKFHDGSEFTASDVVFTANRLINMAEGWAYLYKGIVNEVVAEDKYTVTFKLSKPYGPFVATLCRMYILNEEQVMQHLAEGIYGEFGDYGREWLLSNDAGSGPYKVVELVQNDYFLAEQFDEWHGGWDTHPNAPEQFKIILSNEAATVRTMMSTQTLDISDMWQTPESLEALDKLDGVDLACYSTRLMQNIYLNCTLPPMDDVNIRKAVASLVDVANLIDVTFPGSSQPAGPVSGFTSGHVDCTQYPFSIEKAAEYIANSSYASTIGSYKLEFMMTTSNLAMEKVALSMQAVGKQVGLNIEIVKRPWNDFQERVSTAASTPHMCTCNSGPSFNEAGATLESQFHSKTAGTYENCSWISSPELDAMIDDAMSTIDHDQRYEKYAKLQKYITDELCPTIWLADLVERVAYQTKYIDFPAAEQFRKGGKLLPYLMGYTYFMPDISIYPDR